MLVSDVINFAVSGELKQLRLSYVDVSDADQLTNEATLIGFINLGLIEIYKRFALKKVTTQLTSVVDGASYVQGDDFLYLHYACGADEAETEIPINNEFATMSIFENEPYVLSIVKDDDLHSDITEVNITYVATPTLLTATTDTVPLKYQYIEPLLQFIAYRAHSSLIATEGTDNSTYYRRFEASCKRLQYDGAETPDNQSNYKSWYRGYT